MDIEKIFNVVLYREAQEFLAGLDVKTRKKIYQTFDRKYRMLAFWDKTKPVETLVIATHGFVKKTQKTPQKEIDKAIAIRNLYFGNE